MTTTTTTDIVSLGVGLFLGLMTLLFIFRIVLTWYPQVDLNKLLTEKKWAEMN